MTTTKKAAFSLTNFVVNKFNFVNVKNLETNNLGLDFSPAGIFHSESKLFELKLVVTATESESETVIFKTEISGFFNFQNVDSLENIPDYFYKNSIAILYPFLRSFISTITLQANIRMLILPTLNLSSMEPILRSNTTTM